MHKFPGPLLVKKNCRAEKFALSEGFLVRSDYFFSNIVRSDLTKSLKILK